VRRTDIVRPEHTPLRIEPEVGNFPENCVESQGNVPWDVLEKDQRRLDLGDDSPDVRPEVARVGLAGAISGDAEWLAGIAGSDEIHATAPRSAIEGCEIVPDRSAIQGRVFHPGHENGRREGFPLDVAHAAICVSGRELDSKLEPADSSAQGEPMDGTYSHAIHPHSTRRHSAPGALSVSR